MGGQIPLEQHLTAALEQIEQSRLSPAALLFTGDLTDLGEPDAYARLRRIVEPAAERIGAPVLWLMGNHDERAEMRTHLLDAEPSDEPIDTVWDLDGLRLIGLDSTVPGYHHGELSEAQLDWLAAELATPAPRGTIIGLHHPPVPTPQPLFDVLELQEQHRLAAVLAGSDVRAILGGHLHFSTHSTFAGIPVSVAAATCYTMDLGVPVRLMNGRDGAQSYNLVHLYDDRIVHQVVPIGQWPRWDTFTEEFIARLEAASPQERRELFSRKRPPA